jgi:curved DNA-binding protein CbpA
VTFEGTEQQRANGNGHGADPLQKRIEEGPRGGAATWYDVLEVAEQATAAEIQKAYERALALVEGRSIGGYLMLDPLAAESARADVEAAYAVLGDAERRRAYDERLAASNIKPQAPPEQPPPLEPEPAPPEPQEMPEVLEAKAILGVESAPPRTSTPPLKILAPVAEGAPPPKPKSIPPIKFEPVVAEPPPPAASSAPAPPTAPQVTLPPHVEAGEPRPTTNATLPPGALPDEITGAVLKELREQRGLSLDQLAEQTKVRKPYLRAIEEQDLPNLPDRVYLRGFLTQVARVLRLDRQRVADGYLAFLDKLGHGR